MQSTPRTAHDDRSFHRNKLRLTCNTDTYIPPLYVYIIIRDDVHCRQPPDKCRV